MEYLKNGQIHTALTEGYSSEGYGVVRLDGAVVSAPPGRPGGSGLT